MSEVSIDTSKMSKGERDALEMAELARDKAAGKEGLAAGIYLGAPAFDDALPYPEQGAEDEDAGAEFLQALEVFLEEQVDSDRIDREGEVPDEVIAGLAELGAFGIKIPQKYGGLGLSQTNYARALALLGRYDGNLSALLSAHQSIGIPQPLLQFGTEVQKQKYLPRVAGGEISAFALTEKDVGSDPARMQMFAEEQGDGSWVLNGEKLWCTNGTKAGVLIVMARTSKEGERPAATAFIVEAGWEGVELVTRCHFMGLRALYNGVMRFTDVRVPAENVVLAPGKGLRVALSTLNTGRISLPAACVGLGHRCLEIVQKWASERVQWGAPIGHHAAIADKIAAMVCDVFVLEALVGHVCALVDRHDGTDIRLEAAIAKMWGTEVGWRIVDDTMQIRGGRGYETADSLAHRGEEPIPVERMFRDCRINTIFEGSSEIMRLFIAREALEPHLKVGAGAMDSRLDHKSRLKAVVQAGRFYAGWYPKQWVPRGHEALDTVRTEEIKAGLGAMSDWSRKLARRIFHAMARYGPKLDKQQLVLGRLVDMGAEIYVTTCALARAEALLGRGVGEWEGVPMKELVRLICLRSERRLRRLAAGDDQAADQLGYKVAREFLQSAG